MQEPEIFKALLAWWEALQDFSRILLPGCLVCCSSGSQHAGRGKDGAEFAQSAETLGLLSVWEIFKVHLRNASVSPASCPFTNVNHGSQFNVVSKNLKLKNNFQNQASLLIWQCDDRLVSFFQAVKKEPLTEKVLTISSQQGWNYQCGFPLV